MHAPAPAPSIALIKPRVHICAVLPAPGVIAAGVAPGLSPPRVGISSLARGAPAPPAQPIRHVQAVGLDNAGGDLRRAVRVTRRTSGNLSAQGLSWAGVALIIPRQVTPITANVA